MAYLIEHKTIGYGLIITMIASLGSGIMTFADTGVLEGFFTSCNPCTSLGVALILSIAGYFISAFAIQGLVSLLGGSGNWREMCLVIAGGALPMVWIMPIGIIAVLFYGEKLFSLPGIFEVTNMSTSFYFLYTLILIGLSVFAMIIQSKGIGLVHNFSAWRGFGTMMIFAGVLFVLTFTIAVAVISGILFMG